MDELDGVPCEVLGYHIKTRTQICLTCCVSVVLELIVYLVLTVADVAVVVQHFRDGNNGLAVMTLGLVVLPAIACFTSVMTSPWQWPYDERNANTDGCYCGRVQCTFVMRQLFNMTAFPLAAIYRLSRRIFWSIEAMFHDRDTAARAHAVAKAAESSPFELYHFLQAFLQAAPQIMLQFYILLREDTFRNYETTHVQVISIVASLITMAVATATFQRFESQKVVGRNYPWTSQRQRASRRQWFARTKRSLVEERASQPASSYTELPESDYVMRRFEASTSTRNEEPINDLNGPSTSSYAKSMHLGQYNLNEYNSCDSSSDDEPVCRLVNRQYSVESNVDTVDMDYSPRHAPPPPPPVIPSVDFVLNRMSTLKDMMLLKTEMYVRDKVPRLPENFHLTELKPNNEGSSPTVPDEPDLVMPTRRQLIEGLEQDDFVGKSISFMAWVCFLLQRMLALSAFCYFHPMACLILCATHYLLMAVGLLWETRSHLKHERITFYVFLAYVYVFCILEFKIKFRHPRRVLVGYVVLVLLQNVSMSVWWFGRREYGEAASISSAWWFGYMFAGVVLSGTYALMCWVVYYYLLRPREKVLFDTTTGPTMENGGA